MEQDELRRVVRVTRTSSPFATVEDAARAFGDAARAIPTSDRRHWTLLVDLRSAPGRNDPEFERVVSSLTRAMLDGFARSAMIVRTAVGQLQVRRVSRERGANGPEVFTDESAALTYLRGELPSVR